eukprot:jgi/Hompol1/3308/HPOL_000541-RA
MFGRMMFLRKQRRQISAAIDIATQLIVYHQTFLPTYIERMAMYLEVASWDLLVESAQMVTAMAPDNIDALCLTCLNEMCREGGSKMAPTYLANIYQVLCRVEPKNAMLFYNTARPFIRLANHRPQILDQCQKMIEKAISLKPTVSSFHIELGLILRLQDQNVRARDCYNSAASLDPHDVAALEGLIRCQLLAGEYDAAQEQLDIFNELQKSMGRSAEIAYLNSVLVWKKHGDASRRLTYLKESVELQMQVINSMPLGFEYYVHVNPDFLLDIVKDYMEHCSSDSGQDS